MNEPFDMALQDYCKNAAYSAEVLPPRKNKNYRENFYTVKDLERLKSVKQTAMDLGELVDAISVTDGAGGKNCRFGTMEIILALRESLARSKEIIAHITCVSSTKEDIDKKISVYLSKGIDNILVVKGDKPKDIESKNDFQNAADLVRYLRTNYRNKLKIGVAAHPEGYDNDEREYDARIDWAARALRLKQDAGADYAITQMVFDIFRYRNFIQRAHEYEIRIPIIPGVFLPNPDSKNSIYEQCRLAKERFRISIPLMDYLEGKEVEEQKEIAQQRIVKLCRELTDTGAPGIHFFTMNNTNNTLRILKKLRADKNV